MNENIKNIQDVFNLTPDEHFINLILRDFSQLQALCFLLTIELELVRQENIKRFIYN